MRLSFSLRTLAWASTCTLLACGGSQKTADNPDDLVVETPEDGDIEALFQREMELTGSVEFGPEDNSWVARASAPQAPVMTAQEGFNQATFQLPDDVSVQCFFYTDSVDPGQAITSMLASVGERVELTRVASYRIAAAAHYPVAFFEGRYLTDGPDGKLMGSVKVGISPRFDTPVACLLDQAGYRETFAEFMTEMLGTLQTAEPENPPSRSEIWATSLNGIPVGYEFLHVHEASDGVITSVDFSTSFFPVSRSELATSDTVRVITSDPSGLLSGHYVQINGREPDFDLNLTRKGKTGYTAQGTFKGKELSSNFEVKQGLTHTLSLYDYFQRHASDEVTLEAMEYRPSIDPGAPAAHTYLLSPGKSTIELPGSGSLLSFTRDAGGLPSSYTFALGDKELVGTLMTREGSW